MSPYAWAAVGAVLYGAGLAVLFGIRSRRHRRATGSSGFNGVTHGDGWAGAAGMLFAIALIVGAAALILAALGAVPTLTPPQLLQLLGLLVAAAGLFLAWVSQSAMGNSWRIGVDPGDTTSLVTDGIFSQVRNPIFTAMIATQAGTVLIAPSWLALAGLGLLVLACQLQVRKVEEPYLRATHGTEYIRYAGRTGRFMPILGRHRQPMVRPAGDQ